MKVRINIDEVYPVYTLITHNIGYLSEIEIPEAMLNRILVNQAEYYKLQDYIDFKSPYPSYDHQTCGYVHSEND